MKFINGGTKIFSMHLFAYQITLSVILLILMQFITNTSPNSMLVKSPFNVFYQESSILLADFVNPFVKLYAKLWRSRMYTTGMVFALH